MDYPRLLSRLPGEEQLAEHFTLNSEEMALTSHLRKDGHRLGLAVLLKSYAFLGYPPRQKSDVPLDVVAFIAAQLKLETVSFKRYRWRSRQWHRHLALTRRYFGLRPFADEDHSSLTEWLSSQVNASPTRRALLSVAVGWCRTHHLELPSESVLRRIVNSARRRYFQALYHTISSKVDAATRQRLDELLAADSGTGAITYDRLKQSPGRLGHKTLFEELDKLQAIRDIGIRGREQLAGINPKIVLRLRERARAEDAHQMQRHRPPICYSLLTALLHTRSLEITDGIVISFLELIRKIWKKTDTALEHKVVDDLPQVYGKNRILYRVAKVVTGRPDGTFEEDLFPQVAQGVFQDIIQEFENKEPSYEEARVQVMRMKYRASYRRPLKAVLEKLTFRTNSSVYQPLIDGVNLVRHFIATKQVTYPPDTHIPAQLVTPKWSQLLWEDHASGPRVIKQHFELCVLHKLERALKCREVWVEGACRYGNPDEDMPANWAECKAAHYEKRRLPMDADAFLLPLRTEMAEGLKRFNRFLGSTQPDVTILHPGGGARGVFKVPRLEKRPERPIIQEAKAFVQRRWGLLDLLDILVEADRRANFARFFHTSGQRQVLSEEDIRLRLLLTIFSLRTNVGLKRIHAAAKPTCSYADLRYFRSRYLHADALREAIASLVNCILEIRNPTIWGNGTACASDGKQMAAWDQNLMAEWHPHYHSRGIMAYWHVDTNALCIYSQIKTCTSSEVAAMIEGLVHHDSEMRLEKNFVDSHGQSEVAFAFCRLLGIKLMPRLKRIKYERLYLPDKGMADSLPRLSGVLERPVRWDLIREHYDEIVRHVVAVAEATGPVDSILRRFNSYNRSHPTYRATIELGKAEKTTFLCGYLTEPPIRVEVNEGLNVVENWNGTSEFVHFGRKNEFQTNDPTLQELAVLCLHLLQNAIILTNTVMLERVLLENDLMDRMEPPDLRAMTPLFTNNINPYGEFDLDLSKPSFLDEQIAMVG